MGYPDPTSPPGCLQGKKNVLLVFPRGKVLDDLWCPLCLYQYAEPAKWTREKNIKESQNLEILFVLPYSRDSVIAWTQAANNVLKTLENWKNPVGYDTLTGPRKELGRLYA